MSTSKNGADAGENRVSGPGAPNTSEGPRAVGPLARPSEESVLVVAVLGLGEAGSRYAAGLANVGARIIGFDPYISSSDEVIVQVGDLAEAVSGADVVISLVGASAAQAVANDALPHLRPDAVYADFNTASPGTKADMAADAEASGIDFADVAVLAPVPRAGIRTPLLTSGTGAEALRDRLQPLGVPVETFPGPAGAAAGRKLVRSVFMKGLAAVVLESVAAGQAAGCEPWIRDQMASELGPGAATLVDRLLTGSREHAQRRKHEVEDAAGYLRGLDVPTWTTEAAHAWLAHLVDEGASDSRVTTATHTDHATNRTPTSSNPTGIRQERRTQ